MSEMGFYSELEERIGYAFRDSALLETALTHSSYANEQGGGAESFERLEFLGDAAVGLEVALLIFEKGPELSEGLMTSARASLVRTESLARLAREIGLGRWLRLGVGAERTDLRENDTVLEDAFEALVAAVFLDGGTEAARGVVRGLFTEGVEDQVGRYGGEGIWPDPKTRLQIELQRGGAIDIRYVVLGESGPDHDKWFRVAVDVNGRRLGTGEGKTKKHAEKSAAEAALGVVLGKKQRD